MIRRLCNNITRRLESYLIIKGFSFTRETRTVIWWRERNPQLRLWSIPDDW